MRLFLLDWVRMVFLVLIFLYDSYAALWSNESLWPMGKGQLWDWTFKTFASFSFAGFVVLGAFAFLAGYKRGNIKTTNLIVLVVFGLLAVSFWEGGFNLGAIATEWDIYHYLVLNILCIYLVAWRPNLKWFLGVLGGVLFVLPWKEWAVNADLALPLQRIFTGVCLQDGRGGWHLLPWIGLSWLMYLFGDITVRKPYLGLKEFGLWVPLLGYSFFNWGAYAEPPLSLGFYCYVFNQPVLDFWLQMIPILFLFRLSSSDQVQKIFTNYPVLQWPSKLYINKRLGLAFLVHIIVSSIFGEFDSFMKLSQWRLELYFILTIPMIELLTRFVDSLIVRIRPTRS
ncbi:MAG: hypothetical protein JNM24_19595 [Bdellovibrionaceae bacterium]|nr:hypothetical protein [Pseudobdellovibrionaceae bacterium]